MERKAVMTEKKIGEFLVSDEELDKVAGGVIFNASNIYGADPSNPWEVLDNSNGNVIARFNNKNDAVACAKSFGSNPMNALEVDWAQVCFLRGQS